MTADEQIEAEIKAILEKSFESYAKKDLDGAMQVYAPDADLTVIDSGKDDKCVGLEQLRKRFKRDFAHFESLLPKFKYVSVSSVKSMIFLLPVYDTLMSMVQGRICLLNMRQLFQHLLTEFSKENR